MSDYWIGVLFGLVIGVLFGASTAQLGVTNNCEKVHLLVLDSKAFECKAVAK